MAKPLVVEGLANYRRGLRETDRDTLKLVQAVTRSGAEIVSAQASKNQPRGRRPMGKRKVPKRLADSYRATTSGNRGIVRSPLEHGPIEEYRRGGPHAVNRALDQKQHEVGDELARGFAVLARANGW